MKTKVLLLFKCLAAVVLIASSCSVDAKGRSSGSHSSTCVRGYYRSGSYVQPHHRSGRDGYHNNNWSVKGNVNPYTGKPGTKPRW